MTPSRLTEDAADQRQELTMQLKANARDPAEQHVDAVVDELLAVGREAAAR